MLGDHLGSVLELSGGALKVTGRLAGGVGNLLGAVGGQDQGRAWWARRTTPPTLSLVEPSVPINRANSGSVNVRDTSASPRRWTCVRCSSVHREGQGDATPVERVDGLRAVVGEVEPSLGRQLHRLRRGRSARGALQARREHRDVRAAAPGEAAAEECGGQRAARGVGGTHHHDDLPALSVLSHSRQVPRGGIVTVGVGTGRHRRLLGHLLRPSAHGDLLLVARGQTRAPG